MAKLIPPMRNLTTKSGRQNLEVCLQREGQTERCGCLSLQSQGIVFTSPRQIEPMADLLVRVECPSPDCCSFLTEGIVVGCDACADGSFEITVLFLGQEKSKAPAKGVRKRPSVNMMLN